MKLNQDEVGGFNDANVGYVLNKLQEAKVKVKSVVEDYNLKYTQEYRGKDHSYDDQVSIVVVEITKDDGKLGEMSIYVPQEGEEHTNAFYVRFSYSNYTKKYYVMDLEKLIKEKLKRSTKVTMGGLNIEQTYEEEQRDKTLMKLFRAQAKYGVSVIGIKGNHVELKAPRAKRESTIILDLVPMSNGLYRFIFTKNEKVMKGDQARTSTLDQLVDKFLRSK